MDAEVPARRPRDEDGIQNGDEEEHQAKRVKVDQATDVPADTTLPQTEATDIVVDDAEPSPTGKYILEDLLPPSRSLLGFTETKFEDGVHRTLEVDVGISQYISKDVASIEGIIKQRFTDFLVYEIDTEGSVVHIKSLGQPEEPKKSKLPIAPPIDVADKADETIEAEKPASDPISVPSEPGPSEPKLGLDTSSSGDERWPSRFDAILSPLLPAPALSKLKEMYLEGSEPPFVPDSGWGGRKQTTSEDADTPHVDAEESGNSRGISDRGRGGKRGRGRGRGGRGGGQGSKREDTRQVSSDPIESKAARTALHQAVRELFGGKLESNTSETGGESGSRIVIKWIHGSARDGWGGGRGGRGGGRDTRDPNRQWIPPYIHFTLQKTNRDTHDAIQHLSRLLRVNEKDLTVAGTKDKRGVTTQRVCLRRGTKTLDDVWRLTNSVSSGRRTVEDVTTTRSERGIRAADLVYRKGSLELGMLKGNAFVITLRSVKADSEETINKTMESMKHKGFINYYGMQRFGTSPIPTHSVGLALLQSDWKRAISLIIRPRQGEFLDTEAGRRAWLEDQDIERALELIPRRVVAERAILESFQKHGGDSNSLGAILAIPRNLRLMYVHAYQSYVWNAVVSERIRRYGSDAPVVGDLAYEKDEDDDADAEEPVELDYVGEEAEGFSHDTVAQNESLTRSEPEKLEEDEAKMSSKKSRKTRRPAQVKVLTEKDLKKYSIFDVLMPLPGHDVAYPGGELGEMYREFLKMDGLDPDNWVRKQKEFSLGGSYRKIMHLPRNVSWRILRYTDPDVALAQADEDKLLGFDPPVVDENGKFVALQIELQLGTAAYATMALREVTKTETSSHFQINLTQASEDQKYRSGFVPTE